ncbi:MAG: MGMT family protein [Zestosphaera sp.]
MKLLCVDEDLEGGVSAHISRECFREAVKILLTIIPSGRVVSYSRLAKVLKSHPRSVADVLRGNDEPILVPCHRVVHEDGRLGGYTLNGRSSPRFKERLLLLEGVTITGGRVGAEHFIKLLE